MGGGFVTRCSLHWALLPFAHRGHPLHTHCWRTLAIPLLLGTHIVGTFVPYPHIDPTPHYAQRQGKVPLHLDPMITLWTPSIVSIGRLTLGLCATDYWSLNIVPVRAYSGRWCENHRELDRTYVDHHQGKKIGFDKVLKMIEEMVATLKTEQLDDDHKKEYCAKGINTKID